MAQVTSGHRPLEASAEPPLPRHVAIIMDGNGRWARARGVPRIAGHRAGVENLRRILEAFARVGIPVLTIYVFSTENWNRPLDEVRALMRLLEQMIERETETLNRNGVQVRHIGETQQLSPRLLRKIQTATEMTRDNTRLILNVALNYGGRAEILSAVRRIVSEGVDPDELDEERFGSYLHTAGLPDPDMVIRTAGEMRLSNFLLWQSAYAEYYTTPTYWPDFDEAELGRALEAYAQRNRRFGRLPRSARSQQPSADDS